MDDSWTSVRAAQGGAAHVIATRLGTALAHRTWSLTPPGRGRVFLLHAGRLVLTRPPFPPAALGAPALLWLPAATRGAVEVRAGGDGYTVSMPAEHVQRMIADTGLAAARPLLGHVVIAGPDLLASRLAALTASCEALVEESAGMMPGAAAVIGLHLGLLLVQLWRCADAPGAAVPRPAGAGTVTRFRHLVELHYRDGLHIDAFARLLGVTRAHLHDACRRVTGRTPLALLHQRLLAEACTRLGQTGLSVEQVAYSLGFRDPGYFNRFFKRLSGRSPGAWRREAAARPAHPPPSFAAWP